jgi:mono/diheme cytochrome c family protein
MRTLYIAAAGLLLLSAFSLQDDKWLAPESSKQLKNAFSKDDAKAISKGEKVYFSLCWTCHGETAKGDGPAGVSLTPKPTDLTSTSTQNQLDGELFWKITNGRGTMLSYDAVISENQRWQVVTYIKSLNQQ